MNPLMSSTRTSPDNPRGVSRPATDWHEIYRKVWQFRKEKGYRNPVCEKKTLQEILSNEYYTLYCPQSMLEVEQFDDLEQVQQIAVMILRKYIKEFYSDRQSSWEQSQLSYADGRGTDS